MFFAEFLESLFCGHAFAPFHRRQAFADADDRLGLVDQLHKILIGFGILDHHLRLAVDGQHHGPAGPLELTYNRHGISFEVRKRLDVAADV